MSPPKYHAGARVLCYTSESELSDSPNFDDFKQDARRTRTYGHSLGLSHLRGGKLKWIPKMPLDILYEIFGHLHPLDVLHLARTSRWLRSVLMSRSAICVWKSALSNVPALPFCPADLTEPQYANLVFDEHCHFCLANNVLDVFWACRVRCCKKCINNYFVTEHALELKCPDAVRLYRRESMFPYIVYPKPRRNKPGRVLYYLPVAQAYRRELEEIKRGQREDWVDAMIEWGREKKAEQTQRLVHAALCELWSNHWVYRRSQEFNLVIISFLMAVLVFLWRDKIWPS